MKKLISLALIAATLAGCSSVPMDESKPVYFTREFWRGAGYAQNGKFLNQADAEQKLRQVPQAAEKLDSAERWGWGALGMIAAGATVALTAPRDGNGNYESGQYLLGLGIIIFGSLPFTLTATKRMEEAAEAYNNESFTYTPKRKTSLYLAPLKEGGSAGLRLEF